MTAPVHLPASGLDDLIRCLCGRGWRCLGPQISDGALLLGEIASLGDLPVGVHDHQAPGEYRLTLESGGSRFGCAVGPQALKPLLFAPRECLWEAGRDDSGALTFRPAAAQAPPTAVFGVRACDLAALALQDRHFLDGPHPDPCYRARREALLLVAVNCARAAGTCFCASTGDGPHAEAGYDLLLTELEEGYLVRAGSERGRGLLAELDSQEATDAELEAEAAQQRRATAMQSRSLPAGNLGPALFNALDHPRWDDVAERCLACGNCTSVCPTCFCHSHEEEPGLDGGARHLRAWDSCFAPGHAYLSGHQVRPDVRTRYRQWLTHKLGSWHEQYGRSGCVGCGRCITWCPVGIDLTEEARALTAGEEPTHG